MITRGRREIHGRSPTISGRRATNGRKRRTRLAFFSAAVFLIQEGWNRLEDLGWVEAFGSDSQRAILNLDHLDPFSIRALGDKGKRT